MNKSTSLRLPSISSHVKSDERMLELSGYATHRPGARSGTLSIAGLPWETASHGGDPTSHGKVTKGFPLKTSESDSELESTVRAKGELIGV